LVRVLDEVARQPLSTERKTRRLLVVTRDDPETVRGGVETFCRRLKEVFPGSTVLPYAGSARPGRWLNEARDARAALGRIERELQRNPADVVVANGAAAWAWAGRDHLPPVVTVYHGTYAGYGRMLSRREPLHGLWTCTAGASLERWAGRGAACVAVSERVAMEALRHYGVDAVQIPNAVDLPEPAPRRDRRDRDRFRVLFVGRPTWSKGFDVLVAAAEQRPEWEWLGVGVPEGLHPAIQGLGELDPSEVADCYPCVDAVMVPSRYEGCSYVPLEAMAADCPVVVSDVGSFAQTGRFPYGFVVPKGSVEANLEALEEVRRDGTPFTPKKWVGKHHGFARFARSWRGLIEEMCS